MEICHQLGFVMVIYAITLVSGQRPAFKIDPPKPPPRYNPAASYLALGGGCLCSDSVCTYEAMKTDLYSNNTADLFQLAFFTTIPFFDSVRVITNVNFTIFDTTENVSIFATWIHQWFPYTSIGVLRKVFPAVIRGAMDPWSAIPVFYEVYQNEYFVPVVLNISLNCTRTHSGQVVNTTEEIMDKVKSLWGDNMQWAKSYARYNGPAPYPFDDDRGIAYDVTTFSSTDLLSFSVFCSIYVLFNVAVALVLISSSSHLFALLINKYNQIPYVTSIFWSSAGGGAVYMVLFFIAKIMIISVRSQALNQIPQDFAATLFHVLEIICFAVPSVLVPLHLFSAMHLSQSFNSLEVCSMQHKGACDFCFGRKQRVFWTLSLWFVMGWIQLMAASFIPVIISLLTDSFRSLAMFSILATCILCALVSGAVIIHICEHGSKHTKWIISMLIVLCCIGFLLITAFAVYILVLTEEGLDKDTVAGYVFSLVPTLILAAGAYIANNYLLDKKSKPSDEKKKKGS